MKLRLYTLSPIHIGTGETLSPMDYVVDGQTFYRLSQKELYELLGQLPNGIRTFSDWIETQFDKMRNLRDNYEQSRLSNDINAKTFFREQQQEKVLLDYLRQRGGQRLVEGSNGKQRKGRAPRLGDVREGMRTNDSVYLPGTSIKGALRTALLYDYLQRHGDIGSIEQMIRAQLDNRRVRKEYFADPLEAEAFFCGQVEKGKPRKQEAQMDLLKWIALSDTQRPSGRTQTAVGKINLYLIEKEQTRDRRATPRLIASRQQQASYAEMIAEGQELHSELRVDGVTIAFLLRKYQGKQIRVYKNKQDSNDYYQQLPKKLQRLFNLTEEQTARADAEELEQAIAAHCRTALDRFSRAQLQRQASWQEDYAAQVDQENYAPRIAKGFSPVDRFSGQLMHLGYAAGFQATTVLLYFLEDRGKSALFERVMERFQLGKAPSQKGRYVPNIRRFPKSRRFVDSESIIQPLGWLALLTEDEQLPAINYATTQKPSGSAKAGSTVTTPPKAVIAEYFSGKINYKKLLDVDAVVVKSGNPNRVKVYLSPDHCPELDLTSYRSPLPVGKVIIVKVQVSKKGAIVSVGFGKVK